jgi:hypothetical protein
MDARCLAGPLLLAGLMYGAFAARTYGDEGAWSLRNGSFDVLGEGPTIKRLAFDPSGRGAFGRNLVTDVSFEGIRADVDCRGEATGNQVRIPNCRAVVPVAVQNEDANFPAQLGEGHTLGQSFEVGEGVFSSIRVKLPTWHTADSGATLRLLRNGPEGEVVASRQLENVGDNSWQGLTFEPQPPGLYYVQLSDPQGQIGWWSIDEDRVAGGQAYADGSAVEGCDRTIAVTGERAVGSAELTVKLTPKTLSLQLDVTPAANQQPRQWPLRWATFWKHSGYDVSKEAVPFYRFFTDNQRYMPVEQLKRSDIGGHLTFSGANWIEAEGTDNYDLRFSGRNMSLNWNMTEDELRLGFGIAPTAEEGGRHTTQVEVRLLPRRDTIPDDWPAFQTPDPALTADLNRFFYERAFSYPASSGPSPWTEWSALIRYWFAGPLREGEKRGLEALVVDDEGYVYTWGSAPGWPFPDPRKYDTRHFDTNARFILGAWRYACWRHDTEFLRSQAERLRRAMNYQLTTLGGRDGLIVTASEDVTGRHEGVGNNYWDILPFGHLDAYANAVYYASLEAMAQLEELIGEMGGIDTESPRRSPSFYRRIAERTRAAYNETFWDEEKGRYIGCVDIDGERHDYGFTFVNLEAMAYGLASEEQARGIYHWMESEPTSTGEADTYTRWVFAPRATTIHNPKWGRDDSWNDPPGPVEPWWHFGWHGTDFGEQCQDGGAILYTSFYDLMARTRLLGPDNAWQRWEQILGRYREPDRLCGGAPLYRGEVPQRVNPGWVGVDIPFPESGLVPTWFLYGLMGIEAKADGLHIRPQLPSDVPWLGIRNVSYGGLTLDVRVTPTSARVTSRTPGYRFVWEREFAEGGGVVFAEPPEPVPGFPPPRAGEPPCRAEWIWASRAPDESETIYLRYPFELTAKPSRAFLRIAADNLFVLYVDGREAARGQGWEKTQQVPIARFLTRGRNVIAIEATNQGGPAGVLVTGEITVGGQKADINSGADWLASREAAPDWAAVDFDDGLWKTANSFGRPPVAPWGEIEIE